MSDSDDIQLGKPGHEGIEAMLDHAPLEIYSPRKRTTNGRVGSARLDETMKSDSDGLGIDRDRDSSAHNPLKCTASKSPEKNVRGK